MSIKIHRNGSASEFIDFVLNIPCFVNVKEHFPKEYIAIFEAKYYDMDSARQAFVVSFDAGITWKNTPFPNFMPVRNVVEFIIRPGISLNIEMAAIKDVKLTISEKNGIRCAQTPARYFGPLRRFLAIAVYVIFTGKFVHNIVDSIIIRITSFASWIHIRTSVKLLTIANMPAAQ
ncbi:hypothetical protein RF11_09965 [Thelohanellus kitauei]|uniref:Uncharacterized protein n=1 Tax=Thelohanellus kitauei TaxID=669202 RepID=A0A0C2NA07_THEKT|nr:hypothetical protein RF11_09965 [Thelohanellus kitauei]